MKTDRELLELAAKAAGIEYTIEDSDYYISHKFFGLWLVKHHEPSEYEKRYWNPLTDDGEALRLAVKLGLVVEIGYAARGFLVVRTNTDNWQEFREPWGNCPYAATRRAIVRAAAAIGEAL